MYYNFTLKIKNKIHLNSSYPLSCWGSNACIFGTYGIISIYLLILTDRICIYQKILTDFTAPILSMRWAHLLRIKKFLVSSTCSLLGIQHCHVTLDISWVKSQQQNKWLKPSNWACSIICQNWSQGNRKYNFFPYNKSHLLLRK